MLENIADKGRSHASAGAHSGKNQTVGKASLADWNPTRNQAIAGGIDNGLADSQEKANTHERCNGECESTRNGRGERRENRPPDGSEREHPAWSEAIGKPSPRRLEQGIAPAESAKDSPQFYKIETVFVCDGGSGDTDVHAIQECDGADHEHPENQQPANVSWAGGHRGSRKPRIVSRLHRFCD